MSASKKSQTSYKKYFFGNAESPFAKDLDELEFVKARKIAGKE